MTLIVCRNEVLAISSMNFPARSCSFVRTQLQGLTLAPVSFRLHFRIVMMFRLLRAFCAAALMRLSREGPIIWRLQSGFLYDARSSGREAWFVCS